MNRKIPVLFLTASLLINGFFIGGYLYAGHRTATLSAPGERLAAVAKRLRLTAAQKELFRELKKEARLNRNRYRQKKKRLRNELWKLLVSESGPQEETDAGIENTIHELAVLREQYQKETARLIRRFINGLDGEQRDLFVKISIDNKKVRALLPR